MFFERFFHRCEEGSAARALHTLRLRAITGSKSPEGFTPLAPRNDLGAEGKHRIDGLNASDLVLRH